MRAANDAGSRLRCFYRDRRVLLVGGASFSRAGTSPPPHPRRGQDPGLLARKVVPRIAVEDLLGLLKLRRELLRQRAAD